MLKGPVNKTVILTVLMYGSETWVLRKAEQDLVEGTDTRTLRWMMGIKRIEKMRNEEIRARAGTANINISREARLIWLGHVERKTDEDVVMRPWKTDMVRTCGEKDRRRCSDENMED